MGGQAIPLALPPRQTWGLLRLGTLSGNSGEAV